MSGERETIDGAAAKADAPFDINDQHAVQVRASKARQRGERSDLALKTLMAHEDGRLLLWDVLSDCGVFGSSFQGEATHATAFAEGQRNVGLKLFLRLMKLCPDLYAVMQKENGK